MNEIRGVSPAIFVEREAKKIKKGRSPEIFVEREAKKINKKGALALQSS